MTEGPRGRRTSPVPPASNVASSSCAWLPVGSLGMPPGSVTPVRPGPRNQPGPEARLSTSPTRRSVNSPFEQGAVDD